MEFEVGKEYILYGRYETFNCSDKMFNLVFKLEDGSQLNVKLASDNDLEVGKVYQIKMTPKWSTSRMQYLLLDYVDVLDLNLTKETEEVINHFYKKVPLGIEKLEKELDSYINQIKNKIIKDITLEVVNKYRHEFKLYPAAVKMHHHYIGGLLYHTLSIVKMALEISNNYDCLNDDILISGAILHDIAKVIEFKSPTDDKYSKQGLLLGHLVLGAMEVDRAAVKLGYQNSEEALLLEHILVSHHGQQQFGAAKKPITPDAVVIWLLDTLDSKLRVLDETFADMDPGTFSDAIGVMEKMKCYKTTLK